MNQKHKTALLSVGLTGAFIAGIAPVIAVPRLAAVFVSNGLALPLATRLLLDYYAVFLALPLLAVLIWRFWPNRENRSMAATVFGVLSFVVFIPLMFVALYLPFWHVTPTIQ